MYICRYNGGNGNLLLNHFSTGINQSLGGDFAPIYRKGNNPIKP